MEHCRTIHSNSFWTDSSSKVPCQWWSAIAWWAKRRRAACASRRGSDKCSCKASPAEEETIGRADLFLYMEIHEDPTDSKRSGWHIRVEVYRDLISWSMLIQIWCQVLICVDSLIPSSTWISVFVSRRAFWEIPDIWIHRTESEQICDLTWQDMAGRNVCHHIPIRFSP